LGERKSGSVHGGGYMRVYIRSTFPILPLSRTRPHVSGDKWKGLTGGSAVLTLCLPSIFAYSRTPTQPREDALTVCVSEFVVNEFPKSLWVVCSPSIVPLVGEGDRTLHLFGETNYLPPSPISQLRASCLSFLPWREVRGTTPFHFTLPHLPFKPCTNDACQTVRNESVIQWASTDHSAAELCVGLQCENYCEYP